MLVRLGLVFGDFAKEAVRFVGDPRGEINTAAERKQIPQAIKLERRSIGAHERLDKSARDRIVNVNESVTEIADPKVGAFHERKTPRSIEIPVCNQVPEEITAGVEHSDEPTAVTGDIIMPFLILLGIRHKDFTVEIPDAEWRVATRQSRIAKAHWCRIEVFVEHVDSPLVKVG